MNADELIRTFELGELPAESFSHEMHVKLTWGYLQRLDIPEVMIKIRDGLKAFTVVVGVPEKYNETLSFAYVALIHERRSPQTSENWSAFKAQNPDLFRPWPELMGDYYSPETLTSERAKRAFVLPDLACKAAAS